MEFAPVRKEIASKIVILSNDNATHTFKMKIWTNKTIKHRVYFNEDFSLHYPSSKKGYSTRAAMNSDTMRAKTNFKQAMREEINEGIAFANFES